MPILVSLTVEYLQLETVDHPQWVQCGELSRTDSTLKDAPAYLLEFFRKRVRPENGFTDVN